MKVTAENVRLHADRQFLRPARARGDTMVSIAVKNIADALGTEARFPLICTALQSRIFENEYGVHLVRTEGLKARRRF
jgi:hypothetical protein